MARGGGHSGGGFRGGHSSGGFRHSYHRYHSYHRSRGYYGRSLFSDSFSNSYNRGGYMDGTPFQYSHAQTYRDMERRSEKLMLTIGLFILCLMFSGALLTNAAKSYKKTFLTTGKLTGAIETKYVVDETGLFDEATIKSGGEYFLEKTGIQPVVMLSSDLNYHDGSYGVNLMAVQYDKLFRDECHLLLVITPSQLSKGTTNLILSYYYGGDVDKIMQEDDFDFMWSKLRENIDNGQNPSEAISNTLRSTAKHVDPTRSNIMGRILWFAGIGFAAVIIAAFFFMAKKRHDDDVKIKSVKPEFENDDFPALDDPYRNPELDIAKGELAKAPQPAPAPRPEPENVINWEDAMADINDMKNNLKSDGENVT
ncbi:MAG: hypothetical protein IKN24_09675 [Lachnospiraceae bacterium]|nr:hypothetical protein [Lachnospiraceae bacterium]